MGVETPSVNRTGITGPLPKRTEAPTPAPQGDTPEPARRANTGDLREGNTGHTSGQAILENQPGAKEIDAVEIPGGEAHGKTEHGKKEHEAPGLDGTTPQQQARQAAELTKLPFDVKEFHEKAHEHVERKELREAQGEARTTKVEVKQAGRELNQAEQHLHTAKQAAERPNVAHSQAANDAAQAQRDLTKAQKAASGAPKRQAATAQERLDTAKAKLEEANQRVQPLKQQANAANEQVRAARTAVKEAEQGLTAAEAEHAAAVKKVGHIAHELEAEKAAKPLTGLAKGFKAVGGTVVAGAGVVSVVAGVDEFRQGQAKGSLALEAGGVLDVASGATSSVAGVATTAETLGVAASAAGNVAKLAGTAAGPLAGAASVVTGAYQGITAGHELKEKREHLEAVKKDPHHTVAQLKAAEAEVDHVATERNAGWAKSVGGSLMLAGTAADMTGVGAVAGVPLQIVGGAIVAGASVYENWDKLSAGTHKAAHVVSETAHEATTWAASKFHAMTGW